MTRKLKVNNRLIQQDYCKVSQVCLSLSLTEPDKKFALTSAALSRDRAPISHPWTRPSREGSSLLLLFILCLSLQLSLHRAALYHAAWSLVISVYRCNRSLSPCHPSFPPEQMTISFSTIDKQVPVDWNPATALLCSLSQNTTAALTLFLRSQHWDFHFSSLG